MTVSKLHIFLFLGLTILLISCNGSKALTKKGDQLNAAGLYAEAANMYYVALRKKSTNVEAKIGLKSAGQYVLNGYLDKFAAARGMGEKKDAVYRFIEAEDYYNKIKRVGVELNLADFYYQDYSDIKNDYLDDLYEKGSELLEEEEFDNAHKLFDEISNLDPEFKDAGELKDIAFLEPLYNKGVQAMEHARYREALNYFNKVAARDPNYKKVGQMSLETIEAGKYSVAVMPFENTTSESGLESKMSAYALEALAAVDDPFVKVVDRENMERILEEQRLGLSGVIDESTAVTVGELMGAKAIVTGTVLNYSTTKGKIRYQDKDAFESYKVKKLNKAEQKYYFETKYRQTQYREYFGENKAALSFQFKMISLETGEVILTKIIEKEASDAVNYVDYDGNKRNLFPEKNGGINLNRNVKNQLISKMSARRDLQNPEELSNEVFRSVSRGMTNEIEDVLKEVIK